MPTLYWCFHFPPTIHTHSYNKNLYRTFTTTKKVPRYIKYGKAMGKGWLGSMAFFGLSTLHHKPRILLIPSSLAHSPPFSHWTTVVRSPKMRWCYYFALSDVEEEEHRRRQALKYHRCGLPGSVGWLAAGVWPLRCGDFMCGSLWKAEQWKCFGKNCWLLFG